MSTKKLEIPANLILRARRVFARVGMGDDNESDDLITLGRELAQAVLGVSGFKSKCDDPECLGWVHIFNPGSFADEVQRCDECAIFKFEEDAIAQHDLDCIFGADCEFRVAGREKDLARARGEDV